MKKILTLILTLSLVLASVAPMGTSIAIADESYEETVVCLSTISSITNMNLFPSTDSMKTGVVTAEISGAALSHATEFDVSTSNFTNGNYLEFYMYSANTTDTEFAVILYSDNSATASRDYYYITLKADFTGWKHISTMLTDYKAVHDPVGFDKIDALCILPGYKGGAIDYNSKLYFDDFILRSEPYTPPAVVEPVEPEPYILFDPENVDGVNTKADSTVLTTIDGKPARKWGPGETNLKTAVYMNNFQSRGIDLSKYKELVFEVYCETPTYNPVNVTLGANNPANDTPSYQSDYYYSAFSASWEGGWREVRLSLRYDADGDFTKTRDPIGGMESVTGITLSTHGWAASFFPETVLYLGKIYVEGAPEQSAVGYHGDFIIEDEYNPDYMIDYASILKENNPDKKHPRLIITDEKLDKIHAYKDSDPFMKDAYNKLIETSDVWVAKKPTTPLTNSGIVGDTTRVNCDVKDIVMNCGLAYQLTGDVKYVNRIWDEIVMMADCPTPWSGTNMLDTGEVARAFALAYDWCYDEWNEYQKSVIRNALMKHTFNSALKQLRRGVGSWLTQRGNWNEVIANGVILSALAIGDEPGYENIANEIINRTTEMLPIKGLYGFEPDGAYGEGSAYWNLALKTFFFMTNGMKTALGTDAGLEDFPGLEKTGYFPFGIKGPQGVFNHSDSWKGTFDQGVPVYFYIGYRYNIPQLISCRLNTYTYKSLEPSDVLWYDPEFTDYPADYTQGLPLDYTPSGVEPQGSFRSGYGEDDFFIAFKGGNNFAGHDQYDIGSFVIDALGHRWIEDTGAETYYYTGSRIKYYRLRAEGNNCIQVNPEGNPDIDMDYIKAKYPNVTSETRLQELLKSALYDSKLHDQKPGLNDVNTLCDYSAKNSSDIAAYAVYDLDNAYTGTQDSFTGYLSSIDRGFALINNRSQFIVRDEFSADEAVELYSYFHFNTGLTYEVDSSAMTATLTATDGSRCEIQVITDLADATFGVMDAVHHPASPAPTSTDAKGENNSGFKKFYVHSPATTGGHITVIFTPLMSGEASKATPAIYSFDNWDNYLTYTSSATVSTLDAQIASEDAVFSDVSGHWAQEDITYLYENGIITGSTDGLYYPESSITRAEFIAMVCRSMGLDLIVGDSYDDVSSDMWYAPSIATAKESGIIPSQMLNGSSFSPDEYITREEMCAVMVLAYESSTSLEAADSDMADFFCDVDPTSPYKDYIDSALELCLVYGITDESFAPSSNLTRAQAATVIRRLYNIISK